MTTTKQPTKTKTEVDPKKLRDRVAAFDDLYREQVRRLLLGKDNLLDVVATITSPHTSDAEKQHALRLYNAFWRCDWPR